MSPAKNQGSCSLYLHFSPLSIHRPLRCLLTRIQLPQPLRLALVPRRNSPLLPGFLVAVVRDDPRVIPAVLLRQILNRILGQFALQLQAGGIAVIRAEGVLQVGGPTARWAIRPGRRQLFIWLPPLGKQ